MPKQVAHFLKHFDLTSYVSAYRKIERAQSDVVFFLEDCTKYGGTLMAIIDGDTFQVTKKKVRYSDFEALRTGSYQL